MTMLRRALSFVLLLAVLAGGLAGAALAGPRSGSSFGSRQGFRSGGGMSSPSYSGGGYQSHNYGSGYGYGCGSHFFFFPGFGGYGGFGMMGPLLGVLVVGLAVASIARAVRASRGMNPGSGGYDDDQVVAMPGRAYLYRLQLALGRSARGIQDRLADFAARGDTSTEAGLASLLQQTALELLREKDAVRYVGGEARGPLSLTNAETAMNALALAERSRFQVERVRVSDGRVVRSEAPAEEGKEALELVVVTLLAATRTPLEFDRPSTTEELGAVLSQLGGVSPDGILGLEVIWTPADPNDSMTETDVMTTYPELRSL